MKILVAMSGGVDSSLAAALVLAQGHEAHGVYMKNWINEPGIIGKSLDLDKKRKSKDQ